MKNEFTALMDQVLAEGMARIEEIDDETLKGYFRSMEGPLE